MADKEVIIKKLDQIEGLLKEIKVFLGESVEEFVKDIAAIRAAERDFQLIIDISSDINAEILVGRGGAIPDTYVQAFSQLARENVLPRPLAGKLIDGAKIRNILVHEYDFEEDYEKFYHSAKELLPAFYEYIEIIYNYIREKK